MTLPPCRWALMSIHIIPALGISMNPEPNRGKNYDAFRPGGIHEHRRPPPKRRQQHASIDPVCRWPSELVEGTHEAVLDGAVNKREPSIAKSKFDADFLGAHDLVDSDAAGGCRNALRSTGLCAARRFQVDSSTFIPIQ